jgi:hypothetical protein
VALDADFEFVREVDNEVVVDAQLPGELVDPNLLGGQTFSVLTPSRQTLGAA